MKVLQRCHVPEQRFRQPEEVVVLQFDCGNVGCSWEVKRVVAQAVKLALLNIAGCVSHKSSQLVIDAGGHRRETVARWQRAHTRVGQWRT